MGEFVRGYEKTNVGWDSGQRQRKDQFNKETFLVAKDLLEWQAKRKREKVRIDFPDKEGFTSEFFFSPKWLMREVEQESRKPIPEGETPWYKLPRAGFFVEEEVARMMAKGKLEAKLAYTKLNIEHFENEYLKQMMMLKYNLSWREVHGEKRVICPDMNGATWESVTDALEREGATKEAVRKAEKELKTAAPGSFVIIVSPEGWSNIPTSRGELIEFPETQVYAIAITADGNIDARTLRYKATHEQNELLQNILSKRYNQKTKQYKNQKEQIKGMLRDVTFIDGNDPHREIHSFEDIVDRMQEAVGGREDAYQGTTFADIKAFLADPERFSKPHPLTTRIIDRLLAFIHWEFAQNHSQEVRKKNLEIAYGITITSLNRLYREKEEREKYEKRVQTSKPVDVNTLTSVLLHESRRGMDYKTEHAYLQARPGCAGGGKVSVYSMGGFRTGELARIYGRDIHGPLAFVCENCGHINVRKPGGKENFIQACGERTGRGCGRPVKCA